MTIAPWPTDVSLMSLMSLMSLTVPSRVTGPLSNPSEVPDPRHLATGTISIIARFAGTFFPAVGVGDTARDGRRICADSVARASRDAARSNTRGAKSN